MNHNYQREHHYNVSFVVTVPDRDGFGAMLSDIAGRAGLAPLDLPMSEEYLIDLGFRLWS